MGSSISNGVSYPLFDDYICDDIYTISIIKRYGYYNRDVISHSVFILPMNYH